MLLPDFKRGDTFELPLAVTEKVNGDTVAADITNWTFKMSAREETASGRSVHNFSFQVVSAVEGKGMFVASPEQTKRWPLKTLVMDISILDSEGFETTSQTMQMNVVERISR